MEYLVNALLENEAKIRNVRAFILTAAYNAPSNIDADILHLLVMI